MRVGLVGKEYRHRYSTALVSVLGVAMLTALLSAALANATVNGHSASSTSVTVAFSSKIQTLDPAIAVNFPDQAALHLIGGNLFRLSTNHRYPGLASNYSVSPDGLTWTFVLRKGLRFTNEMPLTSKDVEASFDRAHADKSNANLAEFLPIVSVSAPNPLTVVIKMNRRYSSLPTILGGPPWAIFPASLINTKGFFN